MIPESAIQHDSLGYKRPRISRAELLLKLARCRRL
jgi:hypothetical protein